MLGKLGCWVERINDCSDSSNWKELIDRAKAAGFSWIAVHAANQYLNSQFIDLLTTDIIPYARAEGVQFLSYNVSKPDAWMVEARTIQSLLTKTDGHIICLTDRWIGKNVAAQQFMRLLRKGTKGFCAYSAPVERATQYPLETFEANLDAFMPVLSKDLEASLGSLDKVTEHMKSTERKPTFPVVPPLGTGEMAKAFTIFEGLPFSVRSLDEIHQDKNSMLLGWLQTLNSAGMIGLEAEEDFEVLETENNEDSGIIEEPMVDSEEDTDPNE